jgi:hypothetical protein
MPTDYANPDHWLSLPTSPDKDVDVFYLYPTAYQKRAGESNISTIDNPSMVNGSQAAFARQATAFEPMANIYAPYYRQADATYTLNLPLEQQDQVISGVPTTDARAAPTSTNSPPVDLDGSLGASTTVSTTPSITSTSETTPRTGSAISN